MRRYQLSIFQEALHIFGTWANGEDSRENEGELLGTHGLNFEGVVDRREIEDGAGLARNKPCFFGKFDVLDSSAGYG